MYLLHGFIWAPISIGSKAVYKDMHIIKTGAESNYLSIQ